ncbi:MAG: FAD-dependent oxidoreductase [Terrimicrobiaceae bacterium]
MNPACDILVVGGGVAGLPAAVAAARTGAHVVLVEKSGFLGGAGVAALHRHVCGLYPNGGTKPRETLNAGLTREIVSILAALSPSNRPIQMGRVWVLPFEPAHLRSVYESVARDEQNLAVLFSSAVKSVACDGRHITGIDVRTPDASLKLHPAAVIDATGSGEIIRLSGAPFELAPGPERQLAGCSLHIGGIEGDRELLGVKMAWALSRLPADETRDLPLFASFSPGSADDDGFGKFSLPPSPESQDPVVLNGHLDRLHALLATHLPELAHSRILARSPRMEREGLRLAGRWELDEASLLAACKFPDAVARSAWPIEFWDPSGTAPRLAYPPDGDYADIPARCLRSRTIANLFATGRCISASSRALASTRVMGTCMALGEAAGWQAARSVNRQPP